MPATALTLVIVFSPYISEAITIGWLLSELNTPTPPSLSERIEAMATECQSYRTGAIPDDDLYMRAKISRDEWEELEELLQQNGWRKLNADEGLLYAWDWLVTRDVPRPEWWTPSEKDDGSYLWSDEGYFGKIKYEDGFVFYKAAVHRWPF